MSRRQTLQQQQQHLSTFKGAGSLLRWSLTAALVFAAPSHQAPASGWEKLRDEFVGSFNSWKVAASAPSPPNLTAVVTDLGNSVSPNLPGFPQMNVFRDGGGGVSLNGYDLIIWADTTITDGDNPFSGFQSIIANSASYYNYINKSEPTQLYEFIANTDPKAPLCELKIQNLPEDGRAADGTRFVIWPSSNMVPTGQTTAIGAFPFGANGLGQFGWVGGDPMYNTLVSVDVQSPENGGPQFKREVIKLFDIDETLFGSFTIFNDSNYMYLVGNDKTGLKTSRVAPSTIKDRSTYEFWDGENWGTTLPPSNSAASNILNYTYAPWYTNNTYGPAYGEIYWNEHFSALLCVFMDASVDAEYKVTYSETGKIEGPWSTPQTLYKTPKPKGGGGIGGGGYNYGGHAYPMIDPSGKTLLLGYNYNGQWPRWANVSFIA